MKDNNHGGAAPEFIRNSIWNFTASLMTRIGAFIVTIILARYLLPEGYGLYSLAFTVALFFATFTNLGIDGALIRYFSNSLGRNNKKEASEYYRYLLKIRLWVMIAAFLILFVLAYPISNYVFKNSALFWPLILFSFYVLLSPLDTFYISCFSAIKKMRFITYREILSQGLRIVLIVGILFLFNPKQYINMIILATVLVTIISIFYSRHNLKKTIPWIFQKNQNYEIDKKRITRFLIASAAAGISGVFFAYIDSILLGIYIPQTEYVGFYRAGYTLVFSIIGLLSVSTLLLPYFSSFGKERFADAFRKVFRYIALITIPASFGVFILGKYFLLVYGREYLPAALPIYFFSFIIFADCISGLYGSALSAKEMPQEALKVLVTTSIVNIVLNIVLISSLIKISPLSAVVGASIALLISKYFYLFYIGVLFRKRTHVRIDLASVWKIIFASLIMGGAIYGAIRIFGDVDLIKGIMLIILGVVVYFVVLLILGMIGREEWILVKRLMNVKNN